MKKNKIILILLALLVILLRLPSLFEPNNYADENIYLTLGQGLRHGLVFYRDIHDNKPPLVYILAAIAGNVPTFRFILLIWNLVNVFFFYRLAQKLFKRQLPQVLATLLFAILSSIPTTEGQISNGEIFMIMPATIGALLLFTSTKFLLAGVFFSLAFLFKIPVIFEFAALMFWLIFYQSKTAKSTFKKLFSSLTYLPIIGLLLPILSTILYYYLVGAGPVYVTSALLQNISYLSSWESGSSSLPLYQSQFFIRIVIFTVFIAFTYFFRHRLGKNFGFITLWFIGALFGALLSGRPYPHYFIQLLPPLCLLLGFIFDQKGKTICHLSFSFALLFVTALSLFYYRFWYYPSLPYYKNFLSYASGSISRQDYYRFWGDYVLSNQKIAEFIQKNTTPDQKIFVWGTEPSIYALSDRLPVGRYTVAYHVADFNAYQETIEKLTASPPPFIVYFPDSPAFADLDDFLNLYYAVDQVISPAIIFRLQK